MKVLLQKRITSLQIAAAQGKAPVIAVGFTQKNEIATMEAENNEVYSVVRRKKRPSPLLMLQCVGATKRGQPIAFIEHLRYSRFPLAKIWVAPGWDLHIGDEKTPEELEQSRYPLEWYQRDREALTKDLADVERLQELPFSEQSLQRQIASGWDTFFTWCKVCQDWSGIDLGVRCRHYELADAEEEGVGDVIFCERCHAYRRSSCSHRKNRSGIKSSRGDR